MTQLSPIETLLASVALTPMKQASPMRQKPDTTTCEEMNVWSPIVEWCPIWLPLQRITFAPTRANGCTVLSSWIMVCSPMVQFGQTNAWELMYDAGRYPRCLLY